jgi:hypothetical protein
LILSFLMVFSHFGQYTCAEAPIENKTLPRRPKPT